MIKTVRDDKFKETKQMELRGKFATFFKYDGNER